jgi:hypothetical protein
MLRNDLRGNNPTRKYARRHEVVASAGLGSHALTPGDVPLHV